MYAPPLTDEEAFHASDWGQWRIWLPFVLAADGSEFFQWSMARHVCAIAERALGPYFFQSHAEEEDAILRELEELQARLIQDENGLRPQQLADWYQARAQLLRLQPLVERLLAPGPADTGDSAP